jgi:hypothetical protein
MLFVNCLSYTLGHIICKWEYIVNAVQNINHSKNKFFLFSYKYSCPGFKVDRICFCDLSTEHSFYYGAFHKAEAQEWNCTVGCAKF